MICSTVKRFFTSNLLRLGIGFQIDGLPTIQGCRAEHRSEIDICVKFMSGSGWQTTKLVAEAMMTGVWSTLARVHVINARLVIREAFRAHTPITSR
jgi:hypothetical protein